MIEKGEQPDVNEQRFLLAMEGDFRPHRRGAPQPPTDAQVANALEFVAFRIGRIDQKLGRLIELLEQKQGAS